MGCNLREGKFDVSTSNMIIFAPTFNQVQVNGQWKHKRVATNMGQHTNNICTKSFELTPIVDTFKGVRGINIELYLYLHLYFAYESSLYSDGSTHMLRRALVFAA